MSNPVLLKYVLNFLELLACITGFLSWGKIKHTYWRYFPFFLLFILLIELSAKLLYYLHNESANQILYKYIGLPVQFLFYYWLFYHIFFHKPYRNHTKVAAVVYLLVLLIELLFLDGKSNFLFTSISYSIGNILLLIFLLRFFINFTTNDEVLNYKSMMMFWVAMGLLIFFLGTFPYYAFINIGFQYPELFNSYYYLTFVLNYLMYSFFIAAFVWGKPK